LADVDMHGEERSGLYRQVKRKATTRPSEARIDADARGLQGEDRVAELQAGPGSLQCIVSLCASVVYHHPCNMHICMRASDCKALTSWRGLEIAS